MACSGEEREQATNIAGQQLHEKGGGAGYGLLLFSFINIKNLLSKMVIKYYPAYLGLYRGWHNCIYLFIFLIVS